MRKLFTIILLGCVAAFGVRVYAQNGTSSPFSRYAYGELNDNVANTYRSMGGVGIGMRNNKVICPAQPASYTACDSLTFMFDVAASVMWSRYTDASGTRNKANGNLEYLTLQFPIWRRYIAFSAGILPYSAVGYDVVLQDSINSDYHFKKSYTGDGGISEVYAGLSFNICDWFALGANVYYMFGKVNNVRTLVFEETALSGVEQTLTFQANSIRVRYGAQLFHTFENHSFTLGGIFEAKQPFGQSKLYVMDVSHDIMVGEAQGEFELPMVYGVGGSYTWHNRLTVGFDYSRQCLKNVKILTDDERLEDRDRYCVGAEYRHNPIGRNYAERMQWRVGCNVTDAYVSTMKTKDVSVSIGMGFPLRNAGTVFNTSIEYGHRGDKSTLEEHYMRLTINASIAENWFFKRKL